MFNFTEDARIIGVTIREHEKYLEVNFYGCSQKDTLFFGIRTIPDPLELAVAVDIIDTINSGASVDVIGMRDKKRKIVSNTVINNHYDLAKLLFRLGGLQIQGSYTTKLVP
jgi:hypothetical protein